MIDWKGRAGHTTNLASTQFTCISTENFPHLFARATRGAYAATSEEFGTVADRCCYIASTLRSSTASTAYTMVSGHI